MNDAIPFLSFGGYSNALRKKIANVLTSVHNSGRFVLGQHLLDFERAYAKFSNVRFCVGVGNGFDAIQLSLKALDIGRGHEVIVPANTCVPTWMAISATGATVIPVEPDPVTYNIDVKKIEAAVTSRTRAIVPVHLYGQACDMTSVNRIAKRHNLFVVEDNAQAHGAGHAGRRTGSFGVSNATSFYPTKNLGCLGDGGAVTTNDRALYEKFLRLRNYGSAKKDHNDIIGTNSRLDEIQAAVLSVKLDVLEETNLQRQRLAGHYLEGLRGIDDIVLPATMIGSTHVYHLFVIRTQRRDQLRRFLERNKIDTMIHYPIPPHLQDAYSSIGYKKGSFPITETIAGSALSLPLWPGMKKAQVNRVIDVVRSFYR